MASRCQERERSKEARDAEVRDSKMQLVIGLGNPGSAYAATRHNLGFRVLDELVNRLGLAYNTLQDQYAWAEWSLNAGVCVLLKPLTFMNLSGLALATWAVRNAQGLSGDGESEGLVPVVVCDDLALPLGAVRIRQRGSPGGQKGLESIVQTLGSQEFPRMRLGIGPREGSLPPQEWTDYVLQPFPPGEAEVAGELVLYAADALQCLVADGPEVAAVRFNRRETGPLM